VRNVPGPISQEFIDDLRTRVDIVDVIKEYVPLKKQGQNYTGLCPFHSEKTPSFVVSPYKQIYHCFGCGKGGNVYTFLMEKESFSFPDALAYVAKRCGVPVPQDDVSPEKAKQDSLRDKYFHINEYAKDYFRKSLAETVGMNARAYLERRGLDIKICEKFMLGFAPDSWDGLVSDLLEKGIAENDLVTLGLVVRGQRGNLIDRFRNRVMFPITDER
jgi:DNA primase